jgi:hypothetical protein
MAGLWRTLRLLPQCLECRFDRVATWSLCVFILFTVMIVQVYSHPHVSYGCLSMNGPLLVTFVFAIFVVVGIDCSESCKFSKDGYCDDGGSGSDYSDCVFATDCEVWLSSEFCPSHSTYSFFSKHPLLWRQDCGARTVNLTSASNFPTSPLSRM